MSATYPQCTTFTGGNKAIRINAGVKLSKWTLHSKGKNTSQSARLSSKDASQGWGIAKSCKYKECLVLQRVLGMVLGKGWTDSMAQVVYPSPALSWECVKTIPARVLCADLVNAIQRQIVLLPLARGEKLQNSISEVAFLTSLLLHARHPRYCQAPQLPEVCLSI